jgi:hypothetical protein
MNVDEFRRQCPKLYQQVFAAGVASARRQALAAELIAGSAGSQPQINASLAAVERLQETKKRGAQSMMLRSEIARQLCAL